ncbi:uncharacterized protein [Coffea arabica]|uniref:Uncharacterized protein isoform X1 n=1 Tax=Coffea arabica TaxID=13443 RepID=A0ABM4WXK3_COFAR
MRRCLCFFVMFCFGFPKYLEILGLKRWSFSGFFLYLDWLYSFYFSGDFSSTASTTGCNTIWDERPYDGGVCSRGLMQYLYHQRQRPAVSINVVFLQKYFVILCTTWLPYPSRFMDNVTRMIIALLIGGSSFQNISLPVLKRGGVCLYMTMLGTIRYGYFPRMHGNVIFVVQNLEEVLVECLTGFEVILGNAFHEKESPRFRYEAIVEFCGWFVEGKLRIPKGEGNTIVGFEQVLMEIAHIHEKINRFT